MRASCLVFFTLVLLQFALPGAYAGSIDLGTDAASFAVLGAAAVTNASAGGTAATIINGNLGSTTACTGFASPCTGPANGKVTGTIYLPPSTYLDTAQGQFETAYNALGAEVAGAGISAGGLSGSTLGPGVYTVASETTPATYDLTSTLTLKGTGEWVFLMSSTLEIGSGATVSIGGVGAGSSVFWIVPGSQAVLGPNADFAGNILAYGLVAFDPGATDLCGRAFSETAGVTFAGADPTTGVANEVGGGCGGLENGGGLNGGSGGGGGTPTVPEPGSMLLMATFLMALGPIVRKKLW
jgi:hypothetical protein